MVEMKQKIAKIQDANNYMKKQREITMTVKLMNLNATYGDKSKLQAEF